MKRAVFFFFLAALLLNAPALRKTVEALPFDHPARGALLKALAPVCRVSEATRLSALREAIRPLD